MLKEKYNLINKRYGRLLILELVHEDNTLRHNSTNKRNYNHRWKALCDCGTEKIVSAYCLKYRNTKSCGCLQREAATKYNTKYTENTALNRLVMEYKIGAKQRNLEFDLTFPQAEALFIQNCHYCNSEPYLIKITRKHSMKWNGIDRVDNKKGYTTDNVVPCCKTCNAAKHALTYAVFIEWINKLKAYTIINL